MTYYERITYLIGEYNQLSTYLYSNSVKLITSIKNENEFDKEDISSSLNKLEFDSSIEYKRFLELSIVDKCNYFKLLPLSIQNKLKESIKEQNYLNNLFYIEYDNGFEHEDVQIYNKAIDELLNKNSCLTTLNSEITKLLDKILKNLKKSN